MEMNKYDRRFKIKERERILKIDEFDQRLVTSSQSIVRIIIWNMNVPCNHTRFLSIDLCISCGGLDFER